MTAELVTPRRIVVTFLGDSADAQVEIGPEVTIGQLAVASWALGEQAHDARQGQLIAQARERAAIQAVAAGLQTGRQA